ncbi:DNA-directed RNA polymerase III subunit RPC2 [Perkinsus chesapeaki]|uniref:DNA-directed RNA polymerase subunit beta n=1 Tax=Perkinsus chesapeaki TaxID=330153 RepID=A0A7J6ML01_PERCH|nr:DNA-directed RNA polymerase III subunit RPC2 [Perkinsus chesapeaki]
MHTPLPERVPVYKYASDILVDISYVRGREVVRKNGVCIGRLPVMLRSKLCRLHDATTEQMERMQECPHDPGGYFIIKGTEKVLLMQEQLSNNRIIVETDSKKMIQAVVTSSTADNKSRTVVCFKSDLSGLYVKHSAFTELIPAVIMLRAMGMESDQEIVQMVGTEKCHVDGMILSLQDAHATGVFSQQQALEYLGNKLKIRSSAGSTPGGADATERKMGEALEVLVRQVLSHISVYADGSFSSAFDQDKGGASKPLDFSGKCRFLCLMMRRALDARSDSTLLDDRDYYGNKRLELAGQLIALLFEDLFKSMNTEIKKSVDMRLTKYFQQASSASARAGRSVVGPDSGYPDVLRDIDSERITRGMNRAISSGNWNIKRFRIDRSGVSQVLSRFSFIAALGAMTRVKSQFEKSRKLAGPRALQPSQWGMLCPSDTPEGEQCGLIKALSLLAHVTTPDEEGPIRRLCYSLGVEDAAGLTGEELHSTGTITVFLNGALLGVHRRPQTFMSDMRALRRRGKIGEFVSIYEHEAQRAIIIATDGGRLCRPLIVVKKGRPMLVPEVHLRKLKSGELRFTDFLRLGIIEWVDVNEENNSYIAINPEDVVMETTHLEIEPLTLLGAVAGLVPYPHHNQSPRNTYQCAMGKQAMGNIACNQHLRTDTQLLLLTYPQQPMCKTRTIDLIGYDNLPAGHNASVAVMSYSGYDIEDALIMNKASIDRGFGRCCVTRKYATPLARSAIGSSEELRAPPVIGGGGKGGGRHQRQGGFVGRAKKYAIIDEDGLPFAGEQVIDGGVLINKVSPMSDAATGQVTHWRDTPISYKNPVPSYVDRVIATENEDQAKIFKCITRQTRRPELGDKFSSRHGQKGVIGLIVNQEDMPFGEKGWCPDLIMNPHGFPSRMTVGKLLECVSGKAGVLDGERSYGTAFGGTTKKHMTESLIRHGFHPSAKEYITSGVTGEALECYIFVGPIYYQKLKHMVMDKIHARSTGPVNQLTRQPTEGRAKDGGLRLGEMERDCLVAYGASNLLLERLMLSSDVFTASVCRRCGLLSYQNGTCKLCGTSENIVDIRMPYACKLLFQELQAMNVCPRLKVESR